MKKRIWFAVIAVVVAAIGVGIWLNREWFYDYWRGMTYEPSAEIVQIRDKLGLTERGIFLFNASQPELNERDDFNNNCPTSNVETAVLGCYTEKSIYIYNINNEELAGIRELTAAHELLHAVWARMGEEERRGFVSELTRVFDDNQARLSEELDSYEVDEKQEELYVRAGTEVKDLPEGLERHFAEIFTEQDRIVDYYEGYIGVFERIEAEMDGLTDEMEKLKSEIDTKTLDYEQRMARLNADIVSFNSCAVVVGCFEDENAFYARRGVLVAEQEALAILYDEMGGLVDDYNELVEKYNKDVMYSNKLSNIVNSHSVPEELK